MKSLFVNVGKNTSVTITSSGAGTQFALKGIDNLPNGVITYSIRKGIEEDMADIDGGNGDKMVDVAELKNYFK